MTSPFSLHAQWVVGFVDGEGCFRASTIRNPALRFQTQIQIEFVVMQHRRDVDVLYKLKAFFQCGSVCKGTGQKDGTDTPLKFRVRKLEDLITKIVPFFMQHSLKTKKHVEFLRFRQLCLLLNQKAHLKEEGFHHCLCLVKNLPYVEDSKEMLRRILCFME